MISARFPLFALLPLAALLALLALPGAAQSKFTYPWGATLGGQLNILTAHDHALLLRTRLDRSFDTDYNSLDRAAGGGQLQRAAVLLGYEWRLGERWSGGLIENMSFESGPARTFRTGGFLRHCGHIGSVQFRKRVLAEHLATAIGNLRPPGAGRIRLRADLDRTWQVGALGLRPRLAYEVQFDLALQQQDAATKTAQRTVDYGVLRVECAVDLTERLSIVPYVVRQTYFITAIKQLNLDGTTRVRAGPRNLRTPLVGLDFRYTLPVAKPRDHPARRDLPTFEGYQD